MKRHVQKVLQELKEKPFTTWIDQLTFMRIFFLWTGIIMLFGLVYFFASGDTSYLYYNAHQTRVTTLYDSVYFSFITATTTGFGDIIPVGMFKSIAIMQVVCGMLLLALVTSKLVSIKQDVIMSEIYEISFNERINRIRSSFLLFRQNVGKIIDKIEEGFIRTREIHEIYTYLTPLEDSLHQVEILINRSGKHHFIKEIDEVSTELICNSMIHSFQKLLELINGMNKHQLAWKRDVTLQIIERSIATTEHIFMQLESQNHVNQNILRDVLLQKEKVFAGLKTALESGIPIGEQHK